MQVFICYSRSDKQFAAQLVEDLSQYDLIVWMDVRSIPTGANWDAEVQKGLDTSDVMLVLLSPASTASQNVADERSYFIEKNKPIVPIMVIPCEVPFLLSRRQRVDFTVDYKLGFQQLLRSLAAPKLLDPDSTQRSRPVTWTQAPVSSGASAAPAAAPASAGRAPKKNRVTSTSPDVGIRTYPVIWSDSYNWFNGMGSRASIGEIMISPREIKLVPRDKPITVIPMKSLVAASIQRSVDRHMKLTYYGPDGSFQSLVLMGAQKEHRREITEEVLNMLKLLTHRSLS